MAPYVSYTVSQFQSQSNAWIIEGTGPPVTVNLNSLFIHHIWTITERQLTVARLLTYSYVGQIQN